MLLGKITIFHTFYNQHSMLSKHFASWTQHPRDSFEYILVDDCSPETITEECPNANLSIVRVNQDIPWNIAGARNLGFHLAKTEWVFCGDIDHVVTPEAAKQILALDLSDPNIVYKFRRISNPDGYIGCEAIINILMNRNRFFEVGGYDEDFSGNYGKEETFFRHCLERHRLKLIQCDHISLDWHPKSGATHGLKRDKTINGKLFEEKMVSLKRGGYKNGTILRFGWKLLGS